jgi:hypothetical protein
MRTISLVITSFAAVATYVAQYSVERESICDVNVSPISFNVLSNPARLVLPLPFSQFLQLSLGASFRALRSVISCYRARLYLRSKFGSSGKIGVLM